MLSRESDRFQSGVSKETRVSTSPPYVRVQLELNCGVADKNKTGARCIVVNALARDAAMFLVVIMP